MTFHHRLFVILSGKPWSKPRAEIGRMTRDYVFDVLMWPRDDKGAPVFPEEDKAARGWATERAIEQGMMPGHAARFAARQHEAAERKAGRGRP